MCIRDSLTCETNARRKVGDKFHRMVELAIDTGDAFALTEPKRRSAPARYEVVSFLAAAGRTPAAEVCYYTGASTRTLKSMEDVYKRQALRAGSAGGGAGPVPHHVLRTVPYPVPAVRPGGPVHPELRFHLSCHPAVR